MTVVDYLKFAGELRGMTRAELKRRMPEVLDITDLGDVADDAIGTLSHGFRQRVGVAQAIIHQPKFLILDEPTRGLSARPAIGCWSSARARSSASVASTSCRRTRARSARSR